MSHYDEAIEHWAIARNIIGPTGEGRPVGQATKTLEESVELLDAINKCDRDAIRDAIGDIYVTLVIQCYFHDLTMGECIDAAWGEIKDRKGRMAGGVFVKEAA
jgi:NTP pyrophosphatase (non-canonical NTP hydrolase)